MPGENGKRPPWGGVLGAGKGGGMGGSREGRMDASRAGGGPGGECVCPKCGATVPHEGGAPCYFVKCPKCTSRMVRK